MGRRCFVCDFKISREESYYSTRLIPYKSKTVYACYRCIDSDFGRYYSIYLQNYINKYLKE